MHGAARFGGQCLFSGRVFSVEFSPMIIIAAKTGQLGNRLMLFAHFIATAIEHDLKIVNLAFDEYAHHFHGFDRDGLCRFPMANGATVSRRTARRLLAASRYAADRLARFRSDGGLVDVIRLGSGENLDLNGHDFVRRARQSQFLFVQGWGFRDYTNLAKHAASIRRVFRPHDRYAGSAAELIATARRKGIDKLVGLHVRRGDYADWLGGRFFYSLQQYRDVERAIERAFPGQRIGFLVCSDSAQNPADFPGEHHTFGGSHPVTDLCALASCDLIAGPPSTFTQWASFWGDVPLHAVESPGDDVSPASFKVFPASRPVTCDMLTGLTAAR